MMVSKTTNISIRMDSQLKKRSISNENNRNVGV